MGVDIERIDFTPEDFEAFQAKLREDVQALREVLARPGFGEGPMSLGAELELYFVDSEAMPSYCNTDVLETAGDPRLTLELNRYNAELNAEPVDLAGTPFTDMASNIRSCLDAVSAAAEKHQARAAAVGILPTLRDQDLGKHAITDKPRYHALADQLRRLRGGPFRISIDGKDPIKMETDDVSLEGANTSFQVHLRVEPKDYARVYNATQLTTPVVLAFAGNSPFLLGHRLWHETRIALFKQSVDPRQDSENEWRYPARVSFGNGWVRHGVEELFESGVALHPPLLPIVSDESPREVLAKGELPALHELCLHNGTIWRWNRAIYDQSGHVRIELRCLPAGPSVVDMMANAAFHVGLALGLADTADERVARFPFDYADRNFYRAAQHGTDAKLIWSTQDDTRPREFTAVELAEHLLPMAHDGLVNKGGVDSDEASAMLEIIEERVRTKQTGARWQVQAHERLQKSGEGLDKMLELYLQGVYAGQPVAQWDLP